jgi:hypothetical protein
MDLFNNCVTDPLARPFREIVPSAAGGTVSVFGESFDGARFGVMPTTTTSKGSSMQIAKWASLRYEMSLSGGGPSGGCYERCFPGTRCKFKVPCDSDEPCFTKLLLPVTMCSREKQPSAMHTKVYDEVVIKSQAMTCYSKLRQWCVNTRSGEDLLTYVSAGLAHTQAHTHVNESYPDRLNKSSPKLVLAINCPTWCDQIKFGDYVDKNRGGDEGRRYVKACFGEGLLTQCQAKTC